MELPAWSLEAVEAYLVCLARIGAMLGTLPLYSGGQAPMRTRAALAIMVSLVVFPVVRGSIPPTSFAPVSLALLVAGEAFLGLVVGYMGRFIFTAVELGGTIIGYQMGFATANVFDPQNQRQVSLISQFQNVLAILLFLALDIHHLFLRAMVQSFSLLPPGRLDLAGGVPYLMDLAGHMFVLGIQFSAPVLAVLLLSGLVLGIMSRVFPQLNVFMLSFPLNIGLSFLVIGLTLNLVAALLTQEFEGLEVQFLNLFNLM